MAVYLSKMAATMIGPNHYHNDPKFLDGQVWASSVDTDQTVTQYRLLLGANTLIWVYSACHSVCMF